MCISSQKIFAITLLVIFSVLAIADPINPPAVPEHYAEGPVSPLFSAIHLTSAERAAHALLEGAMQMAEARILTTTCTSSSGAFDLSIYSDGSINNPNFNFVEVESPASTFTLSATIGSYNSFRGQTIIVRQTDGDGLSGFQIAAYKAKAVFNAKGTIMLMNSGISFLSLSGRLNLYRGELIKNFFRETGDSTGPPHILGWGVQSLSMLGFPIQKYWQRSKSVRDDIIPGRTVFVKDRVVGSTACRIIIDTQNYNNLDFFYQIGTLLISPIVPNSPVPQFDF